MRYDKKHFCELNSALERASGERGAFLPAAGGGDETLRLEIETLIGGHDEGGFIDSPDHVGPGTLRVEGEAEPWVGRSIGPYKVLAMLGAGGMGEVYLAQDLRLGRKLALKLLPASFTKNSERVLRFEREARAASALNHPNIITIFEIGKVDDTHYLAAEFIDGQTLRQRMNSTRLSFPALLDVAVQVAAALGVAHEAGIVHRDIKPENLMLRRDGYLKVLDFGLAKLTEPQASTIDSRTLAIVGVETGPGVVMGTARYMSPEQARGLEVDARSDIFSLGVVLYEMIAGCVPFAGATISDALAAILMTDPPPLARYSEKVPAELQRIVTKALVKDRAARYQTAGEFLSDLKRLKEELGPEAREEPATIRRQIAAAPSQSNPAYLRSKISHHRQSVALALAILATAGVILAYFAPARGAIDSVAILPFANEGADPNTEYLSDGITEGIINNLSQLSKLKVMARTTAFRYRGSEVDPRQVGHELKVRAVLTGKVMQRGDTLSIQADLVNVADGSQLWGEHYNRKLSDIFGIQEEITRAISQKLRLKLTGEEQRLLTKQYTDSTDAYQAYLRGRYYWNKRTAEGFKNAIEYFQQAITKDPRYALAYAGLADCYALGYLPARAGEAMPKAREGALRALEIDDTLAEAHASLGLVKHVYDWDWPGAEKEYKRSIELNPNYASAHGFYGMYLLGSSRFDESMKETERALELDPLSLIINVQVANSFLFSRRYDQAIAAYRKTLEIDPSFWVAHELLAQSYEAKEMYGEAIAEYLKARDPEEASSLRDAYEVSGWRGYWRRAVDLARERQSKGQYVSPYEMAKYYARLGEKDQAFEWLEKSYQEREAFFMLKVTPIFDSVRSDPRFADLLRRLGLP